MTSRDQPGRQAAAGSVGAITAPEFDRMMRPFVPISRLAVAVSGGADSVGLMYLLAQWRDWREAKGRLVPAITVLTVNHGLRAEAANEVIAVKKWARAIGFSHKALLWEGPKPGANIQSEARDARYRLMTDWCLAGSVPADLLVAHHLDDQAETFLMRLQRGSGVDGLSGMAALSRRGGVRLLRPLLEVPGERIRASLMKVDHPWIEDPSNEDERYLRVQVRKALPVLEEFGLGRDRLIATTKAMSRARIALEKMTDELEEQAVVCNPYGFGDVDVRKIEKAPDEIALRLLARLVKKIGSKEFAPRLSSLEGMFDAIRQGALGRGRTLGGVKFTPRGHYFLALREPAAISSEALCLRPGKIECWDGRFDVCLKKPIGGEEVRALGKEGVQFLKTQGIGGPTGVPKLVLETLPALWEDERLLVQPQLEFRVPNAPQFTANCLF